jgi:predicted HD phosphohydrolase
MSAAEAEAFRADPLFEDKLRIRGWDDQAKVPGLEVPGLESYRPLIEAHLARPRP